MSVLAVCLGGHRVAAIYWHTRLVGLVGMDILLASPIVHVRSVVFLVLEVQCLRLEQYIGTRAFFLSCGDHILHAGGHILSISVQAVRRRPAQLNRT